MKLTLSRIAEFIAPKLRAARLDPAAMAQGYSIDSRTVQPGELFFALKGERFDGHDFVEPPCRRARLPPSSAKISSRAIAQSAGWCLRSTIPSVALQTLARRCAKCGAKRHRHHRLDGQDHHQRSIAHLLAIKYRVHRTKGNLQQSLWPSARLLTPGAGIRPRRGRDGDVARR
jgi:UDP-N-acetylmuramoyl-tripeptide--D-alanyl-D-alanine ligase